jgi:hypothetical protein
LAETRSGSKHTSLFPSKRESDTEPPLRIATVNYEVLLMDQALMLRIRERAYHIWAANGGDADQNWFRAEAELNPSAAQLSEAQPQKMQLGNVRRKAKKTTSLG